MTEICITDGAAGLNGLRYIKDSVAELTAKTGAEVRLSSQGSRNRLCFNCPEYYSDILAAEVADRVAEVVAVGYKYEYFKSAIKISGLCGTEREILFASLIAADLAEDKKYAFDRVKASTETAIDGVFNFRLKPLKNKWKDIAEYMPSCFVGAQLKEFVTFLLENKRKRAYIDDRKVYDNYYRRLKRCALLGGGEGEIVREVILSNCGEVEIRGDIPPTDEKYLREFYGDRVYFAQNARY